MCRTQVHYGGIGLTARGDVLDLIVRNVSAYRPYSSAQNRLNGELHEGIDKGGEHAWGSSDGFKPLSSTDERVEQLSSRVEAISAKLDGVAPAVIGE